MTTKKISRDVLRKRKYFIIIMSLLAVILFTVAFLKNTKSYGDSAGTDQYDKLSFQSIDKALRNGVNFEELGKDKRHILFFLAKKPYSLEIISYLKKSGVDLKARNSQGNNALEDILLNLTPTHENLEDNFYLNISTLIGLELISSDKAIREASEKCATNSVMTCLKIALYFKALGKADQAKSYAKRSCYTSKDNSICAIAERLILKE